VDDLISDIEELECDARDTRQAMARELCTLAGWFHALGDPDRREIALRLATNMLSEDPHRRADD
jgi:hypothetical protein